MKNIAKLFLALGAALFLLAACGETGAVSGERPGTVSVSSSGAVSLLPEKAEETRLQDYLRLLCRYVNEPVAAPEELEKTDVFFLLTYEAEAYAQRRGQSYDAGEGLSSYRFPAADLQALAQKLFGREFDFASHQQDFYLDQNGQAVKCFDAASDTFYVIFGGALYPERDDGAFVDLQELRSLERTEDIYTAVCRLSTSHGLGTSKEVWEKDMVYRFQVLQEDGLCYYRLQSVETED